MKKLILDIAKKNIFFRKMIRCIYRFFSRVKYFYYYTFNKMEDKYIFFECFGGRNYTCSPKFMYEQMITMNEFSDYKFIWSFKDIEGHDVAHYDNTIFVQSGSSDYYKYLSKSKYWIVNSIVDISIKKKKNQIYVQCWHGTPLKRLRCDIEVNGASLNTIEEIKSRNNIDAARFDYFISPSDYATEKFISAFNLDYLNKSDIIIQEGYPRNDSLFKVNNKIIKGIKSKLNLPIDKKVIFYMPTFRDDQHSSGVGYTYKLEIDFDSLREKFSDEYVILFSSHYFVANSINLEKYKGFIFNVSGYDDINELFIVSDLLITDYSSIFFDYANLKRPIIFYMYDLDNYKGNLRDFYLDLDELPGPITTKQDELELYINDIKKVEKKFSKKYNEFNKKLNYLDNKNASLRVIKKIFKF